MADQDASPPALVRPRRPARADDAFQSPAAPLDPSPAPPAGEPKPSSAQAARGDPDARLSPPPLRGHRHRPSGSFLLADSLSTRHGQPRRRDTRTRSKSDTRRHGPGEQATHAGAQHGREEEPGSRASSSGTQAPAQGPASSRAAAPGCRAEEGPVSTAVANRASSLAGDTAAGPSPRANTAQLDRESAQIVSMALSLSESRRLASRRNSSQPTPPRLSPLPDGAPGGSLRHYIQPPRKMSRTVSPKPDRSPRIGAGRAFAPLQPAFEPGSAYRYHFSHSTLARAQKAKEYLELMAQYRRVLELLPPLEPDRAARPGAASPPGTPNDSAHVSRVSTGEPETRIGRPYNPLQYIRNRKVRARERKAIDGAAQDFNDVTRVSEWIDEVAKWVATGQARVPGNPALPPFAGARAAEMHASPPPANARNAAAITASTTTAASVTKPKRPRVDWVIDPADMLADVYWLEQDDNKKLVEDRHWRRVFPQAPDPPRLATPGSANDWPDAHAPAERATPDPPSSKHEHEHVFSAARGRAQQKLRALKGSHHRQASSLTNRDLLRLHPASLSESSDTDSDRRRRAKGSVSRIPPALSVLESQMEEMIAREQRDAESHPLYDHEARRLRSGFVTPEQEVPHSPLDASFPASHRRTDSRAELSEAESKGRRLKPLPAQRASPRHAAGRTSLEVPSARVSVDYDTSHPNSPDSRPSRDGGMVPAIGMDLSSMSSRPTSPHRNPLTKVKSIFRERSKERGGSEPQPTGEDGVASPLGPAPDSWSGSPEPAGSGVSSPQRKPSRSPIGDRVMGHRPQKSIGSAKMRGDDGSISFRSLFRGPRIDTVLRSGVSKVSDMIWRKEGGGPEEQPPSTPSDDSEAEFRGRSRAPPGSRRGGPDPFTQDEKEKGTLETAPQPHAVPATDHAKLSGAQGLLTQHPPARPISRRSSRFEMLKPPRIDVQNASPSASPPPVLVRKRDSVGSDVESQGGQDGVHAAAARLDAALAFPEPPQPPAAAASSSPTNRHWSIADRGMPAARSAAPKREIARLRALLLSSGIHAMEMDRRASEQKLLPSPIIMRSSSPDQQQHQQHQQQQKGPTPVPFTLPEIARLTPDPSARNHLLTARLAQTDLYPLAARALASSIESSAAQLHARTSRLAADGAPALARRAEALRDRAAGELAALAQSAADAADEAGHDLVVGQRLKVKGVVDAMDTMLRRRRRRFRWVRRAGWLVVEWLLVGCMWYVWFVVMLARVVLGVGKGVVRGVRWLLWL